MRRLIPAALLLLIPAAALADGPRVQVISDPLVVKECSACHMAFQPEFLPARSWKKMMEPKELASHFGDDASLPEAARAQIETYLTSHAAGVAQGKESGKVAASVPAGETPLRITQTGRWMQKHRPGEVNPEAFNSPKVKSKANCQACHKGASQGLYEDDDGGDWRFWKR
ncbi:Diheme cytochrome c [Rhodospirillaceae bacterium LM-1]|nr:Diheme cytochrome c [Rhodospirillaceae bacterium LM-1]